MPNEINVFYDLEQQYRKFNTTLNKLESQIQGLSAQLKGLNEKSSLSDEEKVQRESISSKASELISKHELVNSYVESLGQVIVALKKPLPNDIKDFTKKLETMYPRLKNSDGFEDFESLFKFVRDKLQNNLIGMKAEYKTNMQNFIKELTKKIPDGSLKEVFEKLESKLKESNVSKPVAPPTTNAQEAAALTDLTNTEEKATLTKRPKSRGPKA